MTAVEKMAFGIREFCERNSISTPTYYKMKAQGLGPSEMRFGSVVRVSVEAEAAWRAARSAPGEAEREQVARQAAALKRRSERALGALGRGEA
ncbi:hypothetical protein [Antarcticirhabdus aurantiaca]|uniref:Uncharacterized protein n=1 Tax=Antarcticirhabdus aurantiaca TaxID=2606717 RepID=A0ACD4NJT0_9HYPH|nr:hypothetical protein [Antarcticirhabdus aurantiaca]WAJ27043.1 hypothetical protein OXU80_19555 [Jeongeuplla avenae]